MLPPSSESKCVEWESVYVYASLCFEKKRYGRTVGSGIQSGKIGMMDWENYMTKEMALLRPMD
jgi:hypothetical protein